MIWRLPSRKLESAGDTPQERRNAPSNCFPFMNAPKPYLNARVRKVLTLRCNFNRRENNGPNKRVRWLRGHNGQLHCGAYRVKAPPTTRSKTYFLNVLCPSRSAATVIAVNARVLEMKHCPESEGFARESRYSWTGSTDIRLRYKSV